MASLGRRSAAFGLLFALGLLGCDVGTKELAVRELEGHAAVPVAGDVLELRYAENRDVGFSLLSGLDEPTRYRLLLALVPLVMLGLAIGWWRRREARLFEHFAFGALLAGALGNYLDRVLRGYVVDFIALPHYPVFNVADIAIVIGIALMLLAGRRDGPARGAQA